MPDCPAPADQDDAAAAHPTTAHPATAQGELTAILLDYLDQIHSLRRRTSRDLPAMFGQRLFCHIDALQELVTAEMRQQLTPLADTGTVSDAPRPSSSPSAPQQQNPAETDQAETEQEAAAEYCGMQLNMGVSRGRDAREAMRLAEQAAELVSRLADPEHDRTDEAAGELIADQQTQSVSQRTVSAPHAADIARLARERVLVIARQSQAEEG